MLFTIEYPEFLPATKKEVDHLFIKCAIRKRWVVLTPEEWVRQNFINYLVIEKKVALTSIAIEKQFKVHEKIKRFDIVVFDKEMQPKLLVECKKQDETIKQKTLEQAITYQTTIQAKYLIITNGNAVSCCEIVNGKATFLDAIPKL